jgi:hypothetical protein
VPAPAPNASPTISPPVAVARNPVAPNPVAPPVVAPPAGAAAPAAVTAPPAQVASRPPEPAPAPAPTHVDAPPVRVSFLVYSRTAERRTVALAVGDGGIMTLREGESIGGVEVTRILPDRVELRHAGQPFTVRAQTP